MQSSRTDPGASPPERHRHPHAEGALGFAVPADRELLLKMEIQRLIKVDRHAFTAQLALLLTADAAAQLHQRARPAYWRSVLWPARRVSAGRRHDIGQCGRNVADIGIQADNYPRYVDGMR